MDELISDLISANMTYERCARALEVARETLSKNKDKASRNAFESALEKVTRAETARNRVESEISRTAREISLQYL